MYLLIDLYNFKSI